jgi:hypothetical protein
VEDKMVDIGAKAVEILKSKDCGEFMIGNPQGRDSRFCLVPTYCWEKQGTFLDGYMCTADLWLVDTKVTDNPLKLVDSSIVTTTTRFGKPISYIASLMNLGDRVIVSYQKDDRPLMKKVFAWPGDYMPVQNLKKQDFDPTESMK